jgi:hypothetical protein
MALHRWLVNVLCGIVFWDFSLLYIVGLRKKQPLHELSMDYTISAVAVMKFDSYLYLSWRPGLCLRFLLIVTKHLRGLERRVVGRILLCYCSIGGDQIFRM